MELKSLISSPFLHAGKDLALSPNQRLYPVPLLLTGDIDISWRNRAYRHRTNRVWGHSCSRCDSVG